MTAADRAYAEAAEQGLPPRIVDPYTLDRLAALIAATVAEDGGRRG